MLVAEILLFLLALTVLVPLLVLAIEVLVALPRHPPREMPTGRRPRVGVLIPAHNESLLIAGTVTSILPGLGPDDRVLVVADNCTDDTARVAAAAGAEVVERVDPERRSKVYALDFGVRHFEKAPPEVVIVVDADCEVEGDTLERLARVCVLSGRPTQGLYLMKATSGAGLHTRIAEFAWMVKNQVRAMGTWRMGLPCHLMGSGMAFPWRCISSVPLTGSYISEDYKLGLDLARSGTPAVFCPEAKISSQFPSNTEGIAIQRTRWEHGHIALILGNAPGLLLEALWTGNRPLLNLVIDLGVPPVALLSLLVLLNGFMAVALYIAGGSAVPACLSLAAIFLLSLSVTLAWAAYGRHILTPRDLLLAPLYAMGKLPLYRKFLVRRQLEWVRARRDGE